MPDVSTHLMFGIALALIIVTKKSKVEGMLVVLGSVLIDVERPVSWFLIAIDLDWLSLTSAFHSILGAVMLSFFAASCFNLETVNLKLRFLWILIGCAEHLMLDLTMHPWAEMGLYLLYPLKIPFSFGLVWSDFAFFPLYGILALSIALPIWLVFRKPFQQHP
jgi:hypothetical protein